MPDDIPITVSELPTDEKPNVGRNAIIIAMTREDAGWFKDVLKYYISKGGTPYYKAVCKPLSEKILEGLDRCFPGKGSDDNP